MKKTICLFLTAFLLLTFCSCAEKEGKNNNEIQNSQITSEKNEIAKSENSKNQSEEFEGVVITLDNYKTYFEFKEHFYAYRDEFGDYIDSMTYGVYLCLKDEYEADTSYNKSNVKVKFEVSNSWYGFDFNEQSGEGKRLERITAYNDVYTITEGFQDSSKNEGFEDLTYAAKIESGSVSVWPYDEGGFGEKYKYSVDYPENIKITGITGTLYVRKK
ncbi:MAG: hypothetical protein IJN95_06310 [Clostridia bacterium]|nr:hypothetical protein [Clostridia bacterium]